MKKSLSALAIVVLALGACTKKETPNPTPTPTPASTATPAPGASPGPSASPSATPAPAPLQSASCASTLAWESSVHPERLAWSTYLCGQIDSRFSAFDKAQDAARVCPNYAKLDRSQRISVWADFMVADAKYESGWNPTDRYPETTQGTDSVTKEPVQSEGLWQLSYQDQTWATWCQFNWPKDKLLSRTDPNKTIFNTQINTQCAIGIMANQITKHGKAMLTSGVYWSTLHDGSSYSKIPQILAIVAQDLYYCKALQVEEKIVPAHGPKEKIGEP